MKRPSSTYFNHLLLSLPSPILLRKSLIPHSYKSKIIILCYKNKENIKQNTKLLTTFSKIAKFTEKFGK